ncbi:hypothetical protein Psta_0453 [Pirellula staleyi DSM 6068]|uniref:Uncharacterized protein n=1 Tax=Pirellula staleyi (strain ATCC 27377 / DSM 6068 / ICPB 4128) TaxID=530564 RepID=D2R3B0_PIRSD|nr:hypothetical protein Psta_0453 [Pirellula staleyi DSM 6068]
MPYRVHYCMTGSKETCQFETEAESRSEALSHFHEYMGNCGAEYTSYKVLSCQSYLRNRRNANRIYQPYRNSPRNLPA